MGYTTEFSGRIEVSPPLNAQEVEFLTKFNATRRMHRTSGPYYVDGTGFHGQGRDKDVLNYNDPAKGQPGLWCQWAPTEDGTALEWDGGEKFYSAAEWMKYLIQHFLMPDCLAKKELPFLQANHICSGVIEAQGEDPHDHWDLVVENNVVSRQEYTRQKDKKVIL